MPFLPVDEQLRLIRRGTADVLPEAALADKLRRAAQTGTPLTVKLGVDPTRPDLHLGHAVVLRKLRQFQDLGHRAVLIVGDFTARIGDPSGKSKTRPVLTEAEIAANAETYVAQASAVLDTRPEALAIVRNGDWLGPLTFADVIRLAGGTTVARMLERDDFQTRYRAGEPISVHEFLYPLAQAQDSVHLAADVELGGTDQTFNLLMGRALMEANGLEPQVCLTLPILEGTDGVEKMSKSLDNYVGLTEVPEEMYGKLLSIPDALIVRYATLASDIPLDALPAWEARAETDPRNAKHDLAWEITRLYHGPAGADAARAHFEQTIIQKAVPAEMPDVAVAPGTTVLDAVRAAGFAASNGEARRLVAGGGVKLDGERVDDATAAVALPAVLQVGKRRFARLVTA